MRNSNFEEIINKYHSRCRTATKEKLYKKLLSSKSRWSKENDCSSTDIENLICESMGICEFCKGELNVKNMGLDHSIPLSRNGAKHIENLKIVCKKCNERKGSLTTNEYFSLVEFLNKQSLELKGYVLRKLALKEIWYRGVDKN